jgi:N-acetylneuraminate synthase
MVISNDHPFRSDKNPVLFIAEIGGNHEGDPAYARRLNALAIDAGVDAVKHQIYSGDTLVSEVESPERNQHFKRFQLDEGDYLELAASCADRGMAFMASTWDLDMLAWVDPHVRMHKIGSGDLTCHPILRWVAQTGKPIILSTGMSTIEQIDKAVETLGTDKLVMMHATSTYPLPPEEANLRMITTLQERYQVPVGYSGHERGLQISLAAVALGAVTVERHITLDRTMWGSDQASSLEPKGFEALIRDIRILEQAMGDGVKKVFPGELAPLSRLRRVDA